MVFDVSDFVDYFICRAATASCQSEGAWNLDGKLSHIREDFSSKKREGQG
jgi:beta-glucosidase/6-phospho-beta-glucosidase/beta-galactosidase